MSEMVGIYERKKKELEMKYTRKGRLTPLGKWEIAKLHMMYYPDKDIRIEDYDKER